ncbi:hypothetical protein TNCV_1614651 [Trichonephila clavipes]|uniref:Uncharacterized protein n=1 Tax=Trichonephila clavipes TaxID=2585209 RepID=A0A8X6RUX0_TRICX|nr:hypothetical protein TNCV_1614651 [Trichonephila clavipes]
MRMQSILAVITPATLEKAAKVADGIMGGSIQWTEEGSQELIDAKKKKKAVTDATLPRHPIPRAKLRLWIDASDKKS